MMFGWDFVVLLILAGFGWSLAYILNDETNEEVGAFAFTLWVGVLMLIVFNIVYPLHLLDIYGP